MKPKTTHILTFWIVFVSFHTSLFPTFSLLSPLVLLYVTTTALYGFTPEYFTTNGLMEYVKYFATPMTSKMTTTTKGQNVNGVGRRVVPIRLQSSGTTTKTSHLLYQLLYLILYVLILGTYQSYLYHYPQFDILWKYHDNYEILPWLSISRMFNISQWIACFFQASKYIVPQNMLPYFFSPPSLPLNPRLSSFFYKFYYNYIYQHLDKDLCYTLRYLMVTNTNRSWIIKL